MSENWCSDERANDDDGDEVEMMISGVVCVYDNDEERSRENNMHIEVETPVRNFIESDDSETDHENDDKLEIIPTNKGSDKLCYKGFEYTTHRVNKNNIRWRCVKNNMKEWKCPGSISTTPHNTDPVVVKDHNHVCDYEMIKKDKSMNRMKLRAKSDQSVKPCQIFAEEVHELPNNTRARLPSEASVKRTLRNQRLKNFPRQPERLDEIIIEGDWLMTGGAENHRFLLHDNGPIGTDERVIIFATDECLKHLAEAKAWYMDGNFDLAPRGFTQLYVLRVAVNGAFITVAYALLERKTQWTYTHMLQTLIDRCAALDVYPDPETVHIDFEKAVINAIRAVLGGDVRIQGCFFHLTQSTYRKVQELKLVKDYKENEKFNRFCGMLDALAFLPIGDVCEGMQYLESICPSKAKPLVKYFDESYVRGTYRQIGKQGEGISLKFRRISPHFPPEVWNVRDATVKRESRTNNSTEAWNNRFEHLVGISHPTIWKLIEKMRLEVAVDSTKLAQMYPVKKSSTKRSKVEERQNHLMNLCVGYEDKNITMEDFLTSVSNIIRFRKL